MDFFNIFLKEKALVLSKIINLNQYVIKLEDDKQLFYKPVHSLDLIELKTLKIYIKTNLTNSLIWLLKFFISTFIFFIKKLDSNF